MEHCSGRSLHGASCWVSCTFQNWAVLPNTASTPMETHSWIRKCGSDTFVRNTFESFFSILAIKSPCYKFIFLLLLILFLFYSLYAYIVLFYFGFFVIIFSFCMMYLLLVFFWHYSFCCFADLVSL